MTCSGKYLELYKAEYVRNLGYYMRRNCLLQTGRLALLRKLKAGSQVGLSLWLKWGAGKDGIYSFEQGNIFENVL
jgi:hypothetical protein